MEEHQPQTKPYVQPRIVLELELETRAISHCPPLDDCEINQVEPATPCLSKV